MRFLIAIRQIRTTSLTVERLLLLTVMPSTIARNAEPLTATDCRRNGYRCCGCCERTSFILSNSRPSIVVIVMGMSASSILSNACTAAGIANGTACGGVIGADGFVARATGVQMPSHNRSITVVLIDR